MRRYVLFFPALLVAACLPGEKTRDAGDGGTELDGTAGDRPPYTGDARNDIVIYTGDARNDIAIFDAPGLDAPGVDAPDRDDASGNDAGDAGAPSGCPTATATAGGRTALIGWSYAAQGLIAMRADGSVVSVAPLASSASLARNGDLLLWSAQTPYDPDATSGRYDAVLVDSAANVRWRFTREIGPADYGTVLFVDGRTAAAALGFTINRESAIAPRDEGVAILPDGAVHELPGVTPNGPPRPDGWIPWLTTTPGSVGYQYGFIHAETGEKVPVHMPVLGTSGAFVRDGVYVYRSWTPEGETGLVVDDPAGATWYPTPIGSLDNLDRRLGLSFTALGPLVSVDGRPRWLLRDMNDLIDIGPLPGDDAGGLITSVVGQRDWVLVLRAGVPRWALQLSTTTFVPFAALSTPPPAPAMTTTSFTSVQLIDHWASGTDNLGRIWRLDLATGTGGYLDPAPLRQFVDGCGRHPSELLPDGTVAIGLRDDYTAGAFAQGPTASEWRRVGRPLIGVSGVLLHSVGNLLGVEGTAINTYCPKTPEQWSPLPAGSETPLQGKSSQVVLLPGSAAAFVNTGSISANPGNPTIHPSGGCGLWNDQVHNFETGETFAFPSTYALWW